MKSSDKTSNRYKWQYLTHRLKPDKSIFDTFTSQKAIVTEHDLVRFETTKLMIITNHFVEDNKRDQVRLDAKASWRTFLITNYIYFPVFACYSNIGARL